MICLIGLVSACSEERNDVMTSRINDDAAPIEERVELYLIHHSDTMSIEGHAYKTDVFVLANMACLIDAASQIDEALRNQLPDARYRNKEGLDNSFLDGSLNRNVFEEAVWGNALVLMRNNYPDSVLDYFSGYDERLREAVLRRLEAGATGAWDGPPENWPMSGSIRGPSGSVGGIGSVFQACQRHALYVERNALRSDFQ